MKTTKQMAILLVIALFASSAPLATAATTDARIEVKSTLSKRPSQLPTTTPHVGGQPPACPSGGNCN